MTSVLVGLTGALGNGLVIANLPYLQGALQLNSSEVAWLPASYLMTTAIAGSVLVKYRQLFGIRSFSMVFLAIQVLLIAAHLSVQGLESAVAIRAASGVCGSALLSLGVFYMIQAFPLSRRLSAVTLGIGILAQANLANNQQTIAQRNFDVATAEARVASAEAQKAKADDDLKRVTQLVQRGTVSTSELDATRATQLSMAAGLREAQAVLDGSRQGVRSAQVNDNALRSQVESVRAQLEMAKIDLGYTVVVSPEDGELSDVGARQGQYVTSGSQLLFLVPSARWVIANFKEAQTRNIKVGQHAWFYVDALGAQKFDGVVEKVSPAAGSEFSVLRTDNAIGNFVKIPQRISVRIQVRGSGHEIQSLRPGMSVEASVDTSTSSTPPINLSRDLGGSVSP